MIVDWRGLLSSIRVEWRDRGANCRSGNVNIACPWCGNDPSFHLAIAEQREAFYCYREPDRHSGRHFIALLVKLGIERAEAIRLINSHMAHSQPIEAPRKAPDMPRIQYGWDRFVSALDSRSAIGYLRERDIPNPEQAIRLFDLRVSLAGTWANRLLIPFQSAQGEVQSWTGRALQNWMVPKYLTRESDDSGLLYAPNQDRRGKHCLVIVEGPFDALKLAIIARTSPFIVAALTGKQLNAARLLRLRALSEGCDSILVALDADVNTGSRLRIISDIAGTLRMRYIGRATLPPGHKDPAEIPSGLVLQWLQASRAALSVGKE